MARWPREKYCIYDMAQEICNRVSKDVVREMGPNKTPKAMTQASKAAAGLQQIVQNMNNTLQLKKVSQVHSHSQGCTQDFLTGGGGAVVYLWEEW